MEFPDKELSSDDMGELLSMVVNMKDDVPDEFRSFVKHIEFRFGRRAYPYMEGKYRSKAAESE